MRTAGEIYRDFPQLGPSIGMNGKQQTDTGKQGPGNRRLPLFLSVARGMMPALASLFLLSGCATLTEQIQAWVPDWTGGEGKTAQNVRPRVVETAPVPKPAPVVAGPSREEVLAVQSDLAELGYDPGQVDGVFGLRTVTAIKAFQNDTGMKTDGMITQELADRLAAAPRPETVAFTKVDPETEFGPGRDVPPLLVIHVKNANIPPHYNAGDTYIWSNDRVETVVRVAETKLFWRTNNSQRYTADRNFLIPPSRWEGPSGSGEADARLEGQTSWPLRAGSSLKFEVAGDGRLEEWRCYTTGTRRIAVPAGQFNVVVMVCERSPTPAGEWVRRIWFYAPAVLHYVARTDIMADGSRDSMELVGVRPGAEDWPPAARAGLDRVIQDALDELSEGESSQWSSTFVKEKFEILLGPAYNSGDGGRCRVFELTARSAGLSRIYPARACKSGDDKKWQIPNDTGAGPNGNSFLTSAN